MAPGSTCEVLANLRENRRPLIRRVRVLFRRTRSPSRLSGSARVSRESAPAGSGGTGWGETGLSAASRGRGVGLVAAVTAAGALIATGATGCGMSDAGRAGSATGSAVVPGGLSAARLAGALLPRIPGYVPVAKVESGEYGGLKSVQEGRRLQQAARLDKPHCARAVAALGADPRMRKAPAASVSFVRTVELTAHELLIEVPVELAKEQVAYEVPKTCRTYQAEIGDQRFEYRVVERGEPARGRLRDLKGAARTVGVSVSGGSAESAESAGTGAAESRTKIWYVVFHRGGYVGSITLSGPQASRSDAEELAGRAYEAADRVLF